MPRSRPSARHGHASSADRTGTALVVAGALLAVWACWLASTLPPDALRSSWALDWTGLGSWRLTWVVVDWLQVVGLLVTGTALRRGHRLAGYGAIGSAPLFLLDAWFDVMTSTTGTELWQAVAMAAAVELPVAALLARIAWRTVAATHPAAVSGTDAATGGGATGGGAAAGSDGRPERRPDDKLSSALTGGRGRTRRGPSDAYSEGPVPGTRL